MDVKDITPVNIINGELEKVIPELYELKTVLENNPWHDHETTFFHTLSVLNELHRILSEDLNSKHLTYLAKNYEDHTRKELLILATVLHDIGKKDTIVLKDNISLFPRHELASVVKAKKILKRFTLSDKEIKFILGIIKNHHVAYNMITMDNTQIDNQLKKLKHSCKECFWELVLMVWADTSGNKFLEKGDPESYHFRIEYYKKILNLFWV